MAVTEKLDFSILHRTINQPIT